MKKTLLGATGVLAMCAGLFTAHAEDDAPALQDVVRVTSARIADETELAVSPDVMPLEGADVTRLIARTPGAARIGNGELSGQMQYRGLFGERLNLRVDGQRFGSGGPNLMDPAFHYAPSPLVRYLVIDRGVSPVSEGPGLAGGADAVFKRVDYSDSDEVVLGYDLMAGYRSVDNSVATGGVLGASTDSWRFNLLGSFEEGENYEFADGEVAGSEFTRAVYGLSAGVRQGAHELSLDVRRNEAGPAGNPPFPMDIRYFDTDFAKLGYAGSFDGFDVAAHFNYASVEHAMNNFDMRPAPAMASLREALAFADTRAGDVSVSFDAFNGELELGVDGELKEHSVRIINPANSDFLVTSIPDAEQDRYGIFAEWEGVLGLFESQLGLRVDQHSDDAGQVMLGSALPMGPQMLAMAFNAADHGWDDTTVDAVARFWTPENNGLSWRMTLARKTNTPGYLHRYGWMPLNASGGLADGNIYVGDLNIETETAWIAEAGFDYRTTNAYIRPTVFYRQIDDYIQGVPFDDTVGVIDTTQEMIANMNGDPTPLRFANVDARLYGLDFDYGYDFEGPLRLDGVFSYVRGERRDIDDNLYRISPPSLSAALTWQEARWSASFEVRGVAEQDEVSETNSEEPSDGYVLINLFADWQVSNRVHLSFGIENLADEVYLDHLSGYNRNAASDVAVGERLPGVGRSAFVRIGIVS